MIPPSVPAAEAAGPLAVPEVLHYVGYDDDGGGIVSLVRALAGENLFACRLGLNEGATQRRQPPLPVLAWPPVVGETISPRALWPTRRVARAVAAWLHADARRIFHGHSRAGLLVALWLAAAGERRVVATVHCYGRQRWFYRWAARRLGARLVWLSPAMKRHYGLADESWAGCIPGAIRAPQVSRAAPVAGRLRLGGLGTLTRWKRWHLVLHALAQLPAARRGEVTFEHVGGGDESYRAELEALAARLGLAERVVFRGAEPGPERLLGAIDALVVASGNEPLSIAMLEALHAGVPVIAADSGGARDVLAEGRGGWLFADSDAAALARAIAAARGGADVRPAPLERFTAAVAAADYLQRYRSLLSP